MDYGTIDKKWLHCSSLGNMMEPRGDTMENEEEQEECPVCESCECRCWEDDEINYYNRTRGV